MVLSMFEVVLIVTAAYLTQLGLWLKTRTRVVLNGKWDSNWDMESKTFSWRDTGKGSQSQRGPNSRRDAGKERRASVITIEEVFALHEIRFFSIAWI